MSSEGTERIEAGNLTFSKEAAEFVIAAFGWELTNKGYIWEDDIVPSITGEPVHIEDLAGIVRYEGEARPLHDDFSELVEYVKYRHEEETGVMERD